MTDNNNSGYQQTNGQDYSQPNQGQYQGQFQNQYFDPNQNFPEKSQAMLGLLISGIGLFMGFGIVACPIGLILSLKELKGIEEGRISPHDKSLATAGKWVSIGGIVFSVLTTILMIFFFIAFINVVGEIETSTLE